MQVSHWPSYDVITTSNGKSRTSEKPDYIYINGKVLTRAIQKYNFGSFSTTAPHIWSNHVTTFEKSSKRFKILISLKFRRTRENWCCYYVLLQSYEGKFSGKGEVGIGLNVLEYNMHKTSKKVECSRHCHDLYSNTSRFPSSQFQWRELQCYIIRPRLYQCVFISFLSKPQTFLCIFTLIYS